MNKCTGGLDILFAFPDRVLEENSSYEEDEFYSSDGSDSANEIAPEVQVNSFHPISIEMFISYG